MLFSRIEDYNTSWLGVCSRNMQVFTDEAEITDFHMIQRVVGMFESHRMQRIVACGLLGIEYDDLDLDDFDPWPPSRNSFHGYQGDNRGLSGNHTRLSSSVYQPLQSYYTPDSDPPSPSSVKVQTKETSSERKARLLQESKKSKEKAEKKRLKKQKQKQRKQMEKEKQNEEGKASQQPKAEDGESVNDQEKKDPDSSVKPSAAAKDTDSEADGSEQESSDEEDDTKDNLRDFEELDITSTFVSKAALIAKRQLEQKLKSDQREKKKSPEKEKYKRVPDKLDEGKEAQKKYSATSSLTFEDNVKISTELAVMGNKFASEGDYNTAVKYFTDAIKYNPKEFKLFGNRSFCFEKLQEYEKALNDAELSLGIYPGWVKGLFRKGRALAGLKRYEEAAKAFREVLRLDSSYAEAAQELMRVQIIQLMEYGFTREQSSNALIIHGTVKKALEVLSKLNHQPGAVLNGAPAQVVNVTGVSPVLSANTIPASAQPHDVFKKTPLNPPLGPVHNIPDVGNQPKPVHTKTNRDNKPLELFPVWVGNLIYPVTESAIINLFSKAGEVISVKILSYKRCAFVNFTKQEDCDEAIRRFHGCSLNGMKLVVRYPDRIPSGMGISRSALRAHDLQDENLTQNAGWGKAVGSQKWFRP